MIVVTGGTGFHGTPIVARLAAAGAGVRLLTHTRPAPGHETWSGDLADPPSLRGLCDGVDTLIHAACLVDGDEPAFQAVNAVGTRALLAEARRAGVARVIQVGTTAVYGDGPHRGRVPEPRPTSPRSASRLAGERAVLAAGGTVVRTPYVYGTGDRWFIPALAGVVTRLRSLVDGGRARLSLVAVDDLADAVVALALRPEPPPPGVLCGAHPSPVPVRHLISTVAVALGLPVPSGSITPGEALAALGRRAAPLWTDRWYEADQLWQLTGCSPGPGIAGRFPQYLPWYRLATGARPSPYDG